MAQRSRFFDSVTGDRVYASAAWAEVVGGIIGDGVVATGNELAVSEASPPAMSVRVNTGKAFVRGYYLEVHSGQETLVIGAADATNPRIDRVVVRRDLAGRTAILAVLAGTPAPSPAVPGLTQVEAGIWEIPLAQVLVAAGAASIVNANITDERGARAQGPDVATAVADLLNTSTGHRHEGTAGTGRKVRHADVDAVTANQHHAQVHAVGGADHTGAITDAQHGARAVANAHLPAHVGAVNKTGDVMTGDLEMRTVIPRFTPANGNTVATGYPAGISFTGINGEAGWPVATGLAVMFKTSDPEYFQYAFDNQSPAAAAKGYYRTRDSAGNWTAWAQILDSVSHPGSGHHAQAHAIGGADHTGALTTALHGALVGPASAHRHSDMASIGADDHHAQSHTHASHTGLGANDHHPQVHALSDAAHHTGDAGDINGWRRQSAGGGTAGNDIWVGTTDPGVAATEGDIWIKA